MTSFGAVRFGVLRYMTDCFLDHFSRYAPERIEYGVNRYVNETRRLYSVMDKHLASDKRPYLVGDKCTIAGMYPYPWVSLAAQACSNQPLA
jgi:glutathione S-transferase